MAWKTAEGKSAGVGLPDPQSDPMQVHGDPWAFSIYRHIYLHCVLYQLFLAFAFPNHNKKKINKLHHLDILFITIVQGRHFRRKDGEKQITKPLLRVRAAEVRFSYFCRSTVYQFLHKTSIQRLDVPRLCLDMRLMLHGFLLLPPKLKVKFPSSPTEAHVLS